MSYDPVEDLRAEIARGRALAIVGAGVSIAATGGNPLASWIWLLEDGVDRCLAVAGPLPDGWGDRVRAEIRSGDLDDLLSAAEKISRKLGAPRGGEYRRWLRETFESMKATDRSVLEALRDLGIPLATTNYDGLLEEVTKLKPVTWREGAAVERVARGDDQAVLHLHGFWEDPESVILGIRSYVEVLGDAHAQNVLRALRTVHTLLFVGCGEGLVDPNFGALLRWTREIFAVSEYRHYRLCRDSERDELQKGHPPKERIHVLPYGPDFSDLAAFLHSLRPGVTETAKRKVQPPPSPAERRPPRLPPLPRCFGRDKEVEDLVATLLMDSPPPVPILGGPGTGKSTTTLAALHDPRVAERFGARRYFVRCDGAKSREALAGEIATTLRIEPGPNLEERLLLNLESAPAVLALDNAETPWEANTTAVEDLLSQLAGTPGLALIASVRGEQRPFGPTWREAIRVGSLDLEPARRAFLEVAGERYRNDPDLNRLLEVVDRLPLAVTLLAHQAEGEPDLSGIWKRWQDERVALLRRADGKERLTNLEGSLELSIQGPRMTKPARRLLSFLGMLPDGIAREDVPALLPEEGKAAASTLRRVGLVLADDPRIRALAPVREYVRSTYPPANADMERVVGFYLELAKLGERAGKESGAEAIQRLTPEMGNLEGIVHQGLASPDPEPAILASWSLGQFYSLTGLGTAGVLERAREAARRLEDRPLEAGCLNKIGDIALCRSDHDTARARFEEALSIYHCVDHLLGQANCIKRLGDIARYRSDHDVARNLYEEAIPIFRRIGDALGQADCFRGLGDIALCRSDHDAARARFEEALSIYQRVDYLPGQANCFLGLGVLTLSGSDHDTARTRFEEALSIYQRVGHLLGQANCFRNLGEIALYRSDHDAARARYEEALSSYQRIGSLLGEANCLRGLGDIAWQQSERDTARQHFRDALNLYERIQDPYSSGWAHCRLARTALTPEERREHIEAAREAWTRINRPDLVKDLDEEFGETEGSDPLAAPPP